MTDFSDLEDMDAFNAEGNADAKDDKREKFPCDRCAGSGIATWGYVNIQSGRCNVCNGKGYFLSSPAQRQKAKVSRNKRKEKKANETADMAHRFRVEHKELVEFLESCTWSEFAQSLVQGLNKYGNLSERQMNSAYSMMEKCAANRAKKDAAKPKFDLTRINELFATAQGNGAKKPAIVVDNLRLSLAPLNGRNAGYIYVKDNGNYAGKISPEGVFSAVRECRDEVKHELEELAKDPVNTMIRHGRSTGRCSCCNRELTKKISIDAGIGPICAEKFGLFTY
tara:strand:+ start:157 stop:999 length:843 start_codon:yes stop_codon:yes gene_type:complete